MWGYSAVLVALLLGSDLVYADEREISSLLDEVSEIATKTKLNIDYQPSTVSILNADKLKKIGVRNLHEALALLPGVETSILHIGWKQVIIRGAYNPDTFVFDKYKLYIDGVDIGSDLYSTSYYYLDFPVELIDRIEVLRGSASTIYGPGAFSGAINVITKSSIRGEEDKIFASIGSYGYAKGGFVKHLRSGEWDIGIDSYYQTSNKTLSAGSEFVGVPLNTYARSDYNSLESFSDFSIGVHAKSDHLTIMARHKSEVTDNFYGMIEELEPVKGGYQRNQSSVLEVKHNLEIDKNLALETKIGLNRYAFTFDTTFYEIPGVFLYRINPTYEQINTLAEVSLKGITTHHNWIVGVGGQKIDTVKNEFATTYRNKSGGGPIFSGTEWHYLDGEYGFLNGDNDQWIKSIYAQDIIALSDQWDLSLNVRWDDYQLFDEMVSYRLGSVYRYNDNHIFKAVYGRSYRAPSYVEAFQALQEGFKQGYPLLKPESIDTFEIGYTYKKPDTVFRSIFFYSTMRNVIDRVEHEPDEINDYYNHRQRNAKGVEAELIYQFGNGSELMANLSYVRTQYYSPDYFTPVEFRSPEISEVMSKGYFLYPLTQALSLNTAWYYNGPKRGFVRDDGKTETYGATMVVDETVAYEIDDSSTVTFSVKNLFKESVIYPSYQAKHDGIHREGRNWLMTYEKRF